jgi:hypothetical protein
MDDIGTKMTSEEAAIKKKQDYKINVQKCIIVMRDKQN